MDNPTKTLPIYIFFALFAFFAATTTIQLLKLGLDKQKTAAKTPRF
jgi:hypothetical protein